MKVLCKTYKLFLFEYRAKNFRLAVRKKSAGLLCCFLRLHGDFFKKKFLKSFCIICGLFFRSIPVIEQKMFGRPVKTAFIVSIKSIWKKLFQKTNESFHHFQTLSRKVSASCRFFRRVCWNSNLCVQVNILTKNGSLSKFFSSLDTERFFWPILEKKVAEMSKLDSQFHGNFRVKIF